MPNLKWIKTANLLYLLGIVILGIYFGYERVLLLDGAYRIKTISEFHQFPIWNSRFSSGLNFIIPIAVSFLDVSLRTIVNALVANYLVIPVGVFIFLRYKQKSLKYELAFLIGLTLFNFNSFFFASYEWWVGSFFFFALYRVLDEEDFLPGTNRRVILGLILLMLVLFSHLNAIFCIPLLFVLLFSMGKINMHWFSAGLVLTGMYIALKLTVLASPYEKSFVSGSGMDVSVISSIFTSESMRAFLRSLYTSNLNMVLMLCLIAYHGIVSKKYLPLGLTVSGLAGSVILVGFFFPDYGYNVYTEGWYKMVNLLIPVVLVEILYDQITKGRFGFPLLISNYVFSIAIICIASTTYSTRYDLIAQTCETQQGPVIINTDADLCPSSFMTMPIESSIINQLEHGSKNYFTLNIREHPATMVILEGLQEETPGRFFDFTTPARPINGSELGYDIGGLSYDRYTTYRCVEFVRVLLDE